MSSFDPPLSPVTAALLALGAALVVAWVLYAARPGSHGKVGTGTAVSTVGTAVTP